MAPIPHKKHTIILVVLFCVCAAIWRFFIADLLLALPSDFSYQAELSSVDNFYDGDNDKYLGQEYSNATFDYKTISSTKRGDLIENTFHVTDKDGNEIISIHRSYGIDPVTGKHVADLGNEVRNGYLFAPRNLKPGQPFTYWHVNYDGPADMSYVGKETVQDLEVYLYETHYENTVIDQTKDLDSLEGVPEKWGIVLDPYLKLWVEPVTGNLINYEDDTTAYYYDIKTGEKLDPWNHFSNTFTEESVSDKVVEAKAALLKAKIIQTDIPIIFILLAFTSVLYYFFKKPSAEENENFGISWLIHVFFIAFPITLIIVCWYFVETSINKGNELEFQNRITEIEDLILRRTDIAINSLEGIQGLFQASENVSREEWSTYISQLDLEEKYPGIKAVAYTPIVLDADKTSHELSVQEEGFTGYKINPVEIHESYAPVLYVEPQTERNINLMGFDSFTNEIRNKAMNFARDTGNSALSGKLTFPAFSKDDTKTGSASVLFIPIYQKNLPLSTLEERRQAISGYAFASFWIDDFIDGIFGTTPLGVNFKIYDGTTVNEESLLYEYFDNPEETETDSFRTATDTIYIVEHPWTITFEGLAEFRASTYQKWLTWGLLWLALMLCVLHVFIYFTLVVSRDRAMEWIARFGKASKGLKRSTRKESLKR